MTLHLNLSTIKLSPFVRKVSFLTGNNFTILSDDLHMPIVMLENINSGNHDKHLVVLKENTVFGNGFDRFVKIKNSDKNESVIDVTLDNTLPPPNQSGWKLVAPICFYIKFN